MFFCASERSQILEREKLEKETVDFFGVFVRTLNVTFLKGLSERYMHVSISPVRCIGHKSRDHLNAT